MAVKVILVEVTVDLEVMEEVLVEMAEVLVEDLAMMAVDFEIRRSYLDHPYETM